MICQISLLVRERTTSIKNRICTPLGKAGEVECRHTSALLPGDHSNSVPPDPISNSAVKAVCANGTNAQALEE